MRRAKAGLRIGVLVNAWGRIAGPAAFRRGFMPYGVLAMGAAVIFVGPNAMRAAELTSWAASSWAAGALFRATWLLFAWPTARALLRCPQMAFVRSLPVSWREGAMAVLPWLALVELPWIWLFAAGGGAVAAVGAGANAAAVHALGAWAPGSRPTRIVAFILGFGLLLLPTDLRGRELLVLVPLVALGVGLRGVWCRDPRESASAHGEPRRRGRARLGRWKEPSIARVIMKSLWRGHRGLLVRWAAWSMAPVVAAALAVRANGLRDETSERLLLAALAAGGVLGAAGSAAASSRLLENARWWFDVLGLSERHRRGATIVALAGFAIPIALAQSAMVLLLGTRDASFAGDISRALQAAAAGMVGAASAVVVTEAAAHGSGRDGARHIAFVALAASLEAMGAWKGGLLGLLVAALSTCAVLLLSGLGRRRPSSPVTAGAEET